MTSTVLPAWARAAATLTVVVVFPTPPFWLATVITRVRAGRGTARPLSVIRRRASAATAAARGVCPSAPGIAAAIWARSSVSSCVGASMRSSRVPAGGRRGIVALARARPHRASGCSTAGSGADVSRETRSAPGQPSGVVGGPDRRGKPRPGAAVRVSATSIAELTPSPSLWSRNGPIQPHGGSTRQSATRPVDNCAPNGDLWTTGHLPGRLPSGVRLATDGHCQLALHRVRREAQPADLGPERVAEGLFHVKRCRSGGAGADPVALQRRRLVSGVRGRFGRPDSLAVGQPSALSAGAGNDAGRRGTPRTSPAAGRGRDGRYSRGVPTRRGSCLASRRPDLTPTSGTGRGCHYGRRVSRETSILAAMFHVKHRRRQRHECARFSP